MRDHCCAKRNHLGLPLLSSGTGPPARPISIEAFAEVAAVYELLGEGDVADKITYQSGGESAVYIKRIKALCEKNHLGRARKLTQGLFEDSRSLAWAAIAEKSQQQSDYDQVKSTNFAVRLAVAVSRAKIDRGETLAEMFRRQAEKQAGNEFFEILATIAKEYARQKRIEESRHTIFKLDSYPYLQLEAAHVLAQASKDPSDIDYYHRTAARVFTHGELKHAIHLAHIAAITGDEKHFATTREMIDQHETHTQSKAEAYSALALAYAERSDISTARDIVNKKIVVPDIEAITLARMARIVLSQDSQ